MSLIKVSPSSHPQRRLLLKFAMTSSVFRSIDHILVRVRNAQQMLSLFAQMFGLPVSWPLQSNDFATSLGGRRNVGCKWTAAVYFSPISCQISRYSAAKSSKTIPSLGPIFAQTPSAAQAPSQSCQETSIDVYRTNTAQCKMTMYLQFNFLQNHLCQHP